MVLWSWKMVAIFKPYKILLKNSSVIVIGYNIKVIGKHSYLKYDMGVFLHLIIAGNYF